MGRDHDRRSKAVKAAAVSIGGQYREKNDPPLDSIAPNPTIIIAPRNVSAGLRKCLISEWNNPKRKS